jgi:hypothetical protein
MTTYITPSVTIELVTDRAALIELDVPFEVSAVAVVKCAQCRHVLDIKLLQSIVAEFSARSTSQS